MSKEGFCNYLCDMPIEANEYGLNKLLITRDLAIDFKHRETEMFLRSPELLEKIKHRWSLMDIMKIRAMQNRFIFHISRNSFDTVEPDNLKNFLDYYRLQQFTGFGANSNVFVDYMAIMSGKITNPELIKNAYVFSFSCHQRDMINWFLTYSPNCLPRQFMVVNNFDEFQSYLEKGISFVLFDGEKKTFKEEELVFMFLANFHVFKCHDGNSFETIGYKTDWKLAQPTHLF